MFDFLFASKWLSLFLIGTAVAALIATISIVYMLAPEPDDSWKDRPPTGFRIALLVLQPLLPYVAVTVRENQRMVIRDRLNMAGLGYSLRPDEFIATRWLGLIVGALVFTIFYVSLSITGGAAILLLIIIVPIGFFYPDIALRDAIKKRHHKIARLFPFFLDLLVLSIRAGLTFTTAAQYAVRELPQGPLRSELERFLRDLRTGVSRSEALDSISNRMRLPAFSNFVAAVNQAEESGAPLAEVLASQAEQRRSERFLKAEKLANQAPVKMMFPLVAFLFPLTFIIIFFPIAIDFLRSGLYSLFTH